MNREFNFRGKPIEVELPNKEKLHGYFVYGSLLQGNGLCQILVPIEGAFKNYKVDPETVGQFTGFNDADGEKIYEGDILMYVGQREDNKGREYFRKVLFRNGNFCMIDAKYAINSPLYKHLVDGKLKWRVVGNIYDNPELLEGGAQ